MTMSICGVYGLTQVTDEPTCIPDHCTNLINPIYNLDLINFGNFTDNQMVSCDLSIKFRFAKNKKLSIFLNLVYVTFVKFCFVFTWEMYSTIIMIGRYVFYFRNFSSI